MGGTGIALSRRQIVFAAKETTPGTLVFPVAADAVRPAGDATVTQTPSFMDSKEKADSLDLMDQFTNPLPPGDWACPMYLRLKDMTTKPQGSALLESLLGGYKASGAVTAALKGALTDVATTCTVDTIAGGVIPPIGVITIGSEKILYTGYAKATGVMTGLTRGYAGTTAASHLDNAAVTLTSQYYYPTMESPAFSFWTRIDHTVFFLSGSTCNNATIPVKNEDGVLITLKGQGMRMGWAGTDALAAGAASSATTITVDDGTKYTVGARIHNVTKADHATNGYEITAISGDELTITPGIVVGGGWTTDDVIEGYLPDVGDLGNEVIESRLTGVYLDGAPGSLRSTDITIDCQKSYLSDEVGTQYVSKYVEDMRKVSFSMNQYFMKDDVGKFATAANAVEVPFEVRYGDTSGKILSIYMQRTKVNVPTTNFESPTVSLNTTATALGKYGEDSVYFVVL